MMSSFPWLRLVDQTFFPHYLSFLQHHVHIRLRKGYDEQKTAVVVNHNYQSC